MAYSLLVVIFNRSSGTSALVAVTFLIFLGEAYGNPHGSFHAFIFGLYGVGTTIRLYFSYLINPHHLFAPLHW